MRQCSRVNACRPTNYRDRSNYGWYLVLDLYQLIDKEKECEKNVSVLEIT